MVIPGFKDHISKNTRLAIPVMLSHLGQMLVQAADSMMVGRIGKEPLAAAAFANSVFVVFLIFGIGLSYAVTPLTAQAHGSGRDSTLSEILKATIFSGVAFGAVLFVGISLCVPHLVFFNQPPEVVAESGPYLRLLAYSILPFMIFQFVRQFAEGLGYTKHAMVITITANIVNILLNYVLIFGKMGFEPLGLQGAGIATIIARIVMMIMILGFVFKARRFAAFRKYIFNMVLPVTVLKTILRLGFPMALQLLFEITAFSLAAIMMGWLGTVPLAAHQIAINLSAMTYMASLGIAAAATIRVGNQLGRGDVANLYGAAITSFIMVIAFMAAMGLLFVFGRDFLPTLYIENMEVRRLASRLLILAALYQLSDGIQVVALGVLRGLADVRVPAIITMIAYWGVGLPVGYILGFYLSWGATGIWIGLLVGLTLAALLLYTRFRKKMRQLHSEQALHDPQQ